MQARAWRIAGITGEDALDLTPRELAAILREATDERIAWERLEDRRTASILAMLANCHRGKNSRPYTPDDFLPKYPEPEGKDEEEAFQNLIAAFKASSVAHRMRKGSN